ncbi:hypothetical protein RhiirA4_492950 [Rhizophagus irregularis]|uniref:Uncharacterized protein n=1 Tax=Rhizophagus irregularis TaxID=588596 RepID=A0A2I1HXI2_9GLOM|nr:hypothetical protein RhiirA4_492950 [Rhizophagus irregularis]
MSSLEKILYNCFISGHTSETISQHGKNSSSYTNYLGTKHRKDIQKHDIA